MVSYKWKRNKRSYPIFPKFPQKIGTDFTIEAEVRLLCARHNRAITVQIFLLFLWWSKLDQMSVKTVKHLLFASFSITKSERAQKRAGDCRTQMNILPCTSTSGKLLEAKLSILYTMTAPICCKGEGVSKNNHAIAMFSPPITPASRGTFTQNSTHAK